MRLGAEVVDLDVDAKTIRLSNGQTHRYGTLISTLPLDELARMTRREPWIAAAAALRHSALHVVGVGLRGQVSKDLATKCWMYFPEDNCPFYRVTHFSHYSGYNVPEIGRQWSLMCEISESQDKLVDASTVPQETVQGLINCGMIESSDQVSHVWSRRVEYGYPTPTLGRDAALHLLLPQLERVGILSRGRFGAWKYEVSNMDHSFMQGYEAVNRVVHNSPELTLWEPSVVNTRHMVLGWSRIPDPHPPLE
jgi:protoporphyrinogen oxidase